ncbi:MAG: flagellin lysine-N-methylase [Rickettsiales bacterium]|nr:flagellin lysine-N-methylase [Rickettsiales bacterium]
MNPTRMQTKAVEKFTCLGGECPDTCCKGWGMQLTQETIDKYTHEAPQLLEAVSSGEAEFIMRRDPVTDYCVKFDAGWCGIHRDYGEAFLGDACHFYPRITRTLGSTVITTAALSCPETARLMLYGDDQLALGARSEVRTPFSLRNVLPANLSEDAALSIHQQFIDMAGDSQFSAAHNLMRVSALTRAIEMQPVNVWAEALPMYASMVEGRIPKAEANPADMFNLLHGVHGLIAASPNPRPLLVQLVDRMAQSLGVTFGHQGAMQLADDASACAVRQLARMRKQEPIIEPALRRYVQAQLSQAMFPFAGFGVTLGERVTVIGVRLATLRLALATLGDAPSEAEVVSVVYNLSRFMDHLADPTLSMNIYRETGWVREARLRAILGA